jgi:hypothetical protein
MLFYVHINDFLSFLFSYCNVTLAAYLLNINFNIILPTIFYVVYFIQVTPSKTS